MWKAHSCLLADLNPTYSKVGEGHLRMLDYRKSQTDQLPNPLHLSGRKLSLRGSGSCPRTRKVSLAASKGGTRTQVPDQSLCHSSKVGTEKAIPATAAKL